MYYLLVVFSLAVALLIAVYPKLPTSGRLLPLFPLLVAFICLYLFTDSELAQDRSSYYVWYLNSAEWLANQETRDRFFSYILSFFPSGLTEIEFGIILSALLFSLVSTFLFILANRNVIAFSYIPLITIAVVCDRQFLDATINTTRSTLSGLLFLLGLISRRDFSRYSFWVLSFGIHSLFGALILAVYGLSRFISRLNRRALWISFTIVGAMFVMRLIYGVRFLPDVPSVNFDLFQNIPEAVLRGVLSTGVLTSSLAIQISIGLLIPAIILLGTQPAVSVTNKICTDYASRIKDRLVVFSLTVTLVALLLYPDVVLVQRLFFVAILTLLLFLPFRVLLWISVIKFTIIIVVLSSYME